MYGNTFLFILIMASGVSSKVQYFAGHAVVRFVTKETLKAVLNSV